MQGSATNDWILKSETTQRYNNHLCWYFLEVSIGAKQCILTTYPSKIATNLHFKSRNGGNMFLSAVVQSHFLIQIIGVASICDSVKVTDALKRK